MFQTHLPFVYRQEHSPPLVLSQYLDNDKVQLVLIGVEFLQCNLSERIFRAS